MGTPRSLLKSKPIQGTVHVIIIIAALISQALTLYTEHGFIHCLQGAEISLVPSSTKFTGVRNLTPQKRKRIAQSPRLLQVALCTTPGVPLTYIIRLYVYSKKFLADGSEVSRESLFLIIPESPMGWSPGHLFLSPGTVAPHSCAMGWLSLVALQWPGGVEPGRITAFPGLPPPWLRERHGSWSCC